MLKNYPVTGLKVALYLASATIEPTTTIYTTTGEVTGAGYTAGGIAVDSSVAPAITGAVTYWTPNATFTFSSVTLAALFDCAMIYDPNATTANSNRGVFTFGAMTVTAGNVQLVQPTNNSTTGLVRWTWS
jgi:hypothetical protein